MEQGCGFAVVADEVRKLEAVSPQVALGVEIIGKAGVVLRQISEASAVARSNISEVAAATSEQSQASSSVARNVEQISSMIEDSVNSVHDANVNVSMLERLADELRQSVACFRV